MSLEIQSTNILSRSGDSAVVEITIADSDDIDSATEFLLLRLNVPYKEPDALVKIEKEALDKASKICDEIVRETRSRLYP